MTRFSKITTIISVVLILVIAVLGVVGENIPPHIKKVEIAGGAESAKFADQIIKVFFDRPMDWENISGKVNISPEAEFDTYWNASELTIIFSQPLNPEADYSLLIRGQLLDVYGKEIGEDQKIEFHTRARRLAYIEKGENFDRVILADEKLNTISVLYENPKIIDFGVSENYLIVVTQSDNGQQELLAGEIGSEMSVLEFGQVLISDLDMDSDRSRAVYTVQPAQVFSSVSIPDGPHQLKMYDFLSARSQEIIPPFEVGDYLDVRFTRDGLGLIFRDQEGTNYLMDIAKPEVNVSLGRHIGMSNFSPDGEYVIMLDQPIYNITSYFPVVTIVNSARESREILDGSEFAIDPIFLTNSQKILYAKLHKEFEGSKGVFKIMELDLATLTETEILVDKQGRSLELPKPDPSDRFVVVERYTSEDLLNYENLRNMEFQTKPETGDLVVLNLETGDIVDPGIRGVSARWVD